MYLYIAGKEFITSQNVINIDNDKNHLFISLNLLNLFLEASYSINKVKKYNFILKVTIFYTKNSFPEIFIW